MIHIPLVLYDSVKTLFEWPDGQEVRYVSDRSIKMSGSNLSMLGTTLTRMNIYFAERKTCTENMARKN